MFGTGITLFKLLGFPVRIDASWIILVVIVTWTLASGLFPGLIPGQPQATYWIMAAGGALGLFVSIVLHELSHAVVARKYGIRISGITLFIFGGVAEMQDEPPGPRSEFLMAIAGPLLSLALGLAFFGAGLAGELAGLPLAACKVLSYLGWMNVVLAVFNMIPAFPLDGGRVLRALLWARKNDYRQATRSASALGTGFSIALMFLGVMSIVSGNLIGGFWWCMIGLFLRNASSRSYQHALVRDVLGGLPVSRFIPSDSVSVRPDLPVSELVDDYLYQRHRTSFPVVADGTLVGSVGTREVKGLPCAEWPFRTVGEIASPCPEESTIGHDESAMQALVAMSRGGLGWLFVVNRGEYLGAVALDDLLRFVTIKLELDDAKKAPQRPPALPAAVDRPRAPHPFHQLPPRPGP